MALETIFFLGAIDETRTKYCKMEGLYYYTTETVVHNLHCRRPCGIGLRLALKISMSYIYNPCSPMFWGNCDPHTHSLPMGECRSWSVTESRFYAPIPSSTGHQRQASRVRVSDMIHIRYVNTLFLKTSIRRYGYNIFNKKHNDKL
jgi:hypothetical protein